MDHEAIIREAAARAGVIVRSELTLLRVNDAKQDVEIGGLKTTMEKFQEKFETMMDGNRKVMAVGVAIFVLLEAGQLVFTFLRG